MNIVRALLFALLAAVSLSPMPLQAHEETSTVKKAVETVSTGLIGAGVAFLGTGAIMSRYRDGNTFPVMSAGVGMISTYLGGIFLVSGGGLKLGLKLLEKK